MGRAVRFEGVVRYAPFRAIVSFDRSRYLLGASGCLLLACSPAAVGENGITAHEVQGGTVAPTCEECPEFVAVPSPPDSLRLVIAVAKYELTWNDYLAAIDDGACRIPNPNRSPFFRSAPDDINPNLEWFRIDWPITILDPAEIECYLAWLSNRTGARAVIPTKPEWHWFASAGRPDVRYPWGGDPAAGREMLAGKIGEDVVMVPWPGRREGRVVHKYLNAFKVGQGAPNPWGIHDLLGNGMELTSTPAKSSAAAPDQNALMLAGTSHSDRNWEEDGLNAEFKTQIVEQQFAYHVAIRIVLLGDGQGD